jgi:Rod binding domain-containing protein
MKIPTTTEESLIRADSQAIPLKKSQSKEDDNKKLLQSAKEMESLFLYYVLKAMRQTIPENKNSNELGLGSNMGKDIYTQIFDEELSKKLAGNGEKSLAKMLYKSLEKKLEKQPDSSTTKESGAVEILPKANYLRIKSAEQDYIKLDRKEATVSASDSPNEIPKETTSSSLSRGPGRFSTDDPDGADITEHKIEAGEGLSEVSNDSAAKKLSTMDNYQNIIKEASEKYRLHPALLTSIIKTESAGNPMAISPAGAKGLMQLADTTAADMGVKDVFDPKENINAGAKFLRQLIDRFQDIKKALAAYNAGPETVKRYGGIPPYPETKKYVKAVLANVPEKTNYYE